MLKSRIEFVNNKPFVNVNGEKFSPLAYTTYFDECGEWLDFIEKGYKMFFVNISFTDLPINNSSGFTPFRTGVFETDTPDYSEFDEIVRGIVAKCPDALIFPRINIAMPRKWIKENPLHTVSTSNGGPRESMYSELFMKDGAALLEKMVAHIRKADYADRIAGYQLCGGTTQEWMHHDLCGSYSALGIEKFKEWAFKKYGIENIKAPEKEDIETGALTPEVQKYYEFCNEVPPDTIEYFAKTLKEFINNEQIVGVFYGYNAFVADSLWGLHGLRKIIDSPYIDFFSSPCCYDHNREFGVDWGDMLPADSLKLHGKMYFVECDIRTYLTRRAQDSRPNQYPDNILLMVDSNGNKTVWSGPDTLEGSISAIRKAFSHQIVKSSGIWWFDMWGGWYHDPQIMRELQKMHRIYDDLSNKNTDALPSAEAVLFVDEEAYTNMERGDHHRHSVSALRVAMGSSGIPFDMYLVQDAEKVLEKYKAAIFTAPVPSEKGKKAINLCENLGIPYVSADGGKVFYTTNELREFLISSGVHCYDKENNVVYWGNSFLGVHTVNEGEVKIKLPGKFKVKPLGEDDPKPFETQTITFSAPTHSTTMFEICEYR